MKPSPSLPSPSAPALPHFDFSPSDDFAAAMGEGVVFVVANPLDLTILHTRCHLATSVLVVEASGPNTMRSILWFRFDPVALVASGVSPCRLFADPEQDRETSVSVPGFAALEWTGVCGWVMDRRRI